MIVGILYICTGKYSIFWNSFYKSAKRYFLPGIEKKYYVFTDDPKIKPDEEIRTYYKNPQGFPLDSLLRFDMFESISQDTKECDYLFFFNSNMEFRRTVTSDMILPTDEEGVVGVLHPGYYNSSTIKLPYEKHKRSTAYIPFHRGEEYHYFMGGVNGGTYKSFMQLISTCKENIHKDMNNKVLALYHDESHLNKYFHGKRIKILPPTFGAPEDSKIIKDPYIVILNKIKHGGKYFDKLPKTSYLRRIKFFIKRTYWAITWRMGILK